MAKLMATHQRNNMHNRKANAEAARNIRHYSNNRDFVRTIDNAGSMLDLE